MHNKIRCCTLCCREKFISWVLINAAHRMSASSVPLPSTQNRVGWHSLAWVSRSVLCQKQWYFPGLHSCSAFVDYIQVDGSLCDALAHGVHGARWLEGIRRRLGRRLWTAVWRLPGTVTTLEFETITNVYNVDGVKRYFRWVYPDHVVRCDLLTSRSGLWSRYLFDNVF